MRTVELYEQFEINESFVRGSIDEISARIAGDHVLVWAHDIVSDASPRFYQSKRVIRLPRIDGTLHASLTLYYDGFEDEEWLDSYHLRAFIRPQNEEDFMSLYRLDQVEVVESLDAIEWRADRDLMAHTWDKIFSDGERHDVKVDKVGDRYYVDFFLRGASWVIHEDRGWNQMDRTLYTTRSDWWNMVL